MGQMTSFKPLTKESQCHKCDYPYGAWHEDVVRSAVELLRSYLKHSALYHKNGNLIIDAAIDEAFPVFVEDSLSQPSLVVKTNVLETNTEGMQQHGVNTGELEMVKPQVYNDVHVQQSEPKNAPRNGTACDHVKNCPSCSIYYSLSQPNPSNVPVHHDKRDNGTGQHGVPAGELSGSIQTVSLEKADVKHAPRNGCASAAVLGVHIGCNCRETLPVECMTCARECGHEDFYCSCVCHKKEQPPEKTCDCHGFGICEHGCQFTIIGTLHRCHKEEKE